MDPNLEFYRSILHLRPWECRERMQHLPESERDRVRIIIEREEDAQKREEAIAGRDLVQMAFESLSEITGNGYLESALLGRTAYYYDECMMIRRITNRVAESSSTLVHRIADFDQHIDPFCLDAWKLAYCDVCYVDGGSATLQEIYEARLREEELQTPAEQARELVRDNDLKRARRNAKWMIPAIEGLSEDDKKGWQDKDPDLQNRLCEQLRLLLVERLDQQREFNEIERRKIEEIQELSLKPRNYQDILEEMWKQVSPAPPPWIQHILQTGEQFGFVYYRSREVYKTRWKWRSVWGRIRNTSSPLGVTWASIHCQGRDNWMKLSSLAIENWPVFSPNEEIPEEDDLRQHFKEYIRENQSKTLEDEQERKKLKKKQRKKYDYTLSPGILRNTFIVIPFEFASGNLNLEHMNFMILAVFGPMTQTGTVQKKRLLLMGKRTKAV
ncbi:hypothetical protein H9Q74_002591 [Fusarium xylarioides]|nr:hypothetical protein H9Q71_003030 [Fusarium xylarioides]KAG5827302.1 hypothetical protein H9Q74_002591 [Fusarium xylarioides]